MRLASNVSYAAVAVGRLAIMATAADVQQLAAALSPGARAERKAAADALDDLGSAAQSAVPQLISAVASEDSELLWRAAQALGLIGDAKAIDALRKLTT